MEESEKNAEGATKRHIEKYKEVFNDSVNKRKGTMATVVERVRETKRDLLAPARGASVVKSARILFSELNAKQKSEQAKLKRIEDAERQRKKAARAGKRRKRESKNHRKRTKHGQPLMKYQWAAYCKR